MPAVVGLFQIGAIVSQAGFADNQRTRGRRSWICRQPPALSRLLTLPWGRDLGFVLLDQGRATPALCSFPPRARLGLTGRHAGAARLFGPSAAYTGVFASSLGWLWLVVLAGGHGWQWSCTASMLFSTRPGSAAAPATSTCWKRGQSCAGFPIDEFIRRQRRRCRRLSYTDTRDDHAAPARCHAPAPRRR